MRILYVDDSDSVRFLIPPFEAGERVVREVVFVDKRATALTELARMTFDVVVLDLGLPDAPRPDELARDVRRAHAGLLVIASGDDRAPAIARDVGATCLMKPFTHRDLMRVLGLEPAPRG